MIQITLIGDAEVKARFDQLVPNTKAALLRSITKLTIDLQTHVVDDKLSGQVLHMRTGTLARSINQHVEDNGSEVIGIVGANMEMAKYAAVHEYGFEGVVSVREHTRRQTMAWGNPITPVQVSVAAHAMHMNMPERSYLRSSLKDMQSQILSELTEAVQEAIQ